MDNRGHIPRVSGFTKEIRSNNSRRIYPEDDENDAISIQSIEQNSSPNSQSQLDERFIRTNKNDAQQRRFSLNDQQSILSMTSMKGLAFAGGIILVISSIIVLPSVLTVILTRNPKVTDATTSSTPAPTIVSAYWGFDNDATDVYGTYNGAVANGAAFSNNTYFGYGYNLFLNASANQSITVSSPFFNLSYTSFTVEAWIFSNSLSGDNAIFSQCQCNSCQDHCLFLIIRNYKMYMGFTLDDVIGVTILSGNTWYHVAYVYDYSTKTQSVYLQGVLDNSKTSSGPYQGQNGSIVIGSSPLSSSSFDGFIDNLKLTTRAKTAAEILDDASIVVHFSFDGTSLTQDVGPNGMNGTLSNAAAATGKVGQGLAFSGAASSYLQIYGFYQLGQSNKPFSFALWIYPYSINGGVLIQKSTYANSGGWCYSLMGLNYVGQISMVIYTSYIPTIVGPILPVRTWTHLGYTYSTTNGVQMYINGVLFGTTRAVSWSSSGMIDWLSIGSYVSGYCGTAAAVLYPIPYQGAIDEFYVFRREVTASEMLTLANP